jgi:glycosyltransferase A (GT-A) superfamily protein (DUF2064 family)
VSANALLLFAKPPIPGFVKTRLTHLKDGYLSPEAASGLYHCMFFDVVEICCDALAELEQRGGNDEYELFISTTPAENVTIMERIFAESGEWPRPITFICDEGASFDEHYNHAFEQMWERGFDTVLSMGVDMPTLPRSVVVEGFDGLHELLSSDRQGIVLSPDQEMGVSIIGWTRETDFDHTGVFYNQDGLTVLPAYIGKARRLGLPAIYLPAVVDIDTIADLNHNITLIEAIDYCAPFSNLSKPHRTLHALQEMGLTEVRVMPNDLHDPREGIDR